MGPPGRAGLGCRPLPAVGSLTFPRSPQGRGVSTSGAPRERLPALPHFNPQTPRNQPGSRRAGAGPQWTRSQTLNGKAADRGRRLAETQPGLGVRRFRWADPTWSALPWVPKTAGSVSSIFVEAQLCPENFKGDELLQEAALGSDFWRNSFHCEFRYQNSQGRRWKYLTQVEPAHKALSSRLLKGSGGGGLRGSCLPSSRVAVGPSVLFNFL